MFRIICSGTALKFKPLSHPLRYKLKNPIRYKEDSTQRFVVTLFLITVLIKNIGIYDSINLSKNAHSLKKLAHRRFFTSFKGCVRVVFTE